MKKILLVFLVILLASGGLAYATATSETLDSRAKPLSAYGKTSGGVVTAIQVDSSGAVVISGSGGDGVFTVTDGELQLDTTYSGYNMTIANDVTIGGAGIVVGTLDASTLNTGQGDNELYDMDQNVLTTSDVTFNDLEVDGDATFNGAFTVNGSGTEGVITMPDSASTDHDLTVGTNSKIYIDGSEYASGATTSASSVTYVTSVTDDFAVGGTDTGAALYFDESTGDLEIDGALTTGGDSANFLFDVPLGDDYAQLQISTNEGDATKLADLTVGQVIFTNLEDGDDLKIGVDLTVDGNDIYFKGVKLT